MTTLDQVAPEAPETGIAVPGEAAPAPAPVTPAAPPEDVEARARAQGWVSKEEFKGPAEKWRPADEFVKRGEEIPGIATERFRTLERKLAQQEQDKRALAATIANMERMSTLALQRQRDMIVGQYEAAIHAAVETGDTGRYRQLTTARDRDLNGFDQQVAEKRQPQPVDGIPPSDVDYAKQWKAKNTWFDEMKNPALYHATNAHLFAVMDEMPAVPFEKQMEVVEARIREQFPTKFGLKPAAQARPASVEGGGRVPVSSGPRKRGASDLPADAARQADRFINEGLYKNRAEYADFYFSQPGV